MPPTKGPGNRTDRSPSASDRIDPQQVIQKARSHLLQKEGDLALSVIAEGLKSHPTNFPLRLTYAQILGDIAGSKPAAQRKRMRMRSIRLLEELLRSSKGQTAQDRWKIRRHLYYFSEQHLKNYRLGVAEVSRGNQLGYLSQAFGAEGHALELLLKKGQVARAEKWAARGEQAWQNLFKVDSVQFNRLCSLAIVLAIQGKAVTASETLRKAAELAKKPLSGFSDLQEMMGRIEKARLAGRVPKRGKNPKEARERHATPKL